MSILGQISGKKRVFSDSCKFHHQQKIQCYLYMCGWNILNLTNLPWNLELITIDQSVWFVYETLCITKNTQVAGIYLGMNIKSYWCWCLFKWSKNMSHYKLYTLTLISLCWNVVQSSHKNRKENLSSSILRRNQLTVCQSNIDPRGRTHRHGRGR